MIIDITQKGDSRVPELLRDYRDLTDVALRSRREPELGVFIAEGAAVITRAVSSGYKFRSVLCEEKWIPSVLPSVLAETPILVAPRKMLAEITGYQVHRGALAAMLRKPLRSPQELLAGAARILILEGLVNHTNVGAIIRNAAAFGMDALLIDQYCADPLYRRAIRTSMGSVFSLPWTRLPDWPADAEIIRDTGFAIVALTPTEAALDITTIKLPKRIALVLGTEGEGLRTATTSVADISVRIPMRAGIDSLNVAAAAAVVMYAIGGAHHA